MNEKTFHLLGIKMPRSSQSSSRPRHASQPPVAFANPLSSVGHPTPSAPTFGQTLKDGLAFGAGSAIAHRLINPFPSFGMPASSETKRTEPCDRERLAFETCMKTKSSDDFCGEQQMSYTQCIRLSKDTN